MGRGKGTAGPKPLRREGIDGVDGSVGLPSKTRPASRAAEGARLDALERRVAYLDRMLNGAVAYAACSEWLAEVAEQAPTGGHRSR